LAGSQQRHVHCYIAREVPELGLLLPSNAVDVDKDFLPGGALFAIAPSGTGFRISLYGLAGILLAVDEGLELNILGLNIGTTQPCRRPGSPTCMIIQRLILQLCCQPDLSELLKDTPKFRLRHQAHGSIRVQEGQPAVPKIWVTTPPLLEAKQKRLLPFAMWLQESRIGKTIAGHVILRHALPTPVLDRDTHLGPDRLEPDLDLGDLIRRKARLPRESKPRGWLPSRDTADLDGLGVGRRFR
jgi:hypothetical protein